jgi:hypothetical protein
MVASILVLATGGIRAQNENETVGFQTNHLFESGQFGENIDVLNGGLNLTTPIGPRYQVNARLGYQLVLNYNSKVWDTSHYLSESVFNTHEVVPYNEGPMGIGFSMHLGRIFIESRYIEGRRRSKEEGTRGGRGGGKEGRERDQQGR